MIIDNKELTTEQNLLCNEGTPCLCNHDGKRYGIKDKTTGLIFMTLQDAQIVFGSVKTKQKIEDGLLKMTHQLSISESYTIPNRPDISRIPQDIWDERLRQIRIQQNAVTSALLKEREDLSKKQVTAAYHRALEEDGFLVPSLENEFSIEQEIGDIFEECHSNLTD